LTPSEIARRILRRDALGSGQAAEGGTPETAIIALQRSFSRVTDDLRDAMGDAGCAALLDRALAHTKRAHPVVKDLRWRPGEGIALAGIATNAGAHGIESVTAAMEALITALVDILSRLIGDDMVLRLLDHDDPQPQPRGGAREP
jgi:hypothetical protein